MNLLRTTPLLFTLLVSGAAAHAAPATPSLAISPTRLSLQLGDSHAFRAQLRNVKSADRKAMEQQLTWTVNGDSDAGSVSGSGLYTAPVVCATPCTVRVRVSVKPPNGCGEDLTAEAVVVLKEVTVAAAPLQQELGLGQTAAFKAKIDGTEDQRLTWSVEGGPENGAVNSAGLYTAPTQALTPRTVRVRATSVADPSKNAVVTVHLREVTVESKEKELQIRLGESRRFKAVVKGTPHDALEWSVLEPEHGTVSPAGLYAPPEHIPTPAVVTLVATSVADRSKKATLRVRILPVEISLGGEKRPKGDDGKNFRSGLKSVGRTIMKVTNLWIPLDPIDRFVVGPMFRGKSGKTYVPCGGVRRFQAQVRNALNETVTWSVEGGEQNGTISSDGFYQAPDSLTTPRMVTIKAISQADPTKVQTAVLHIPPVVLEPPKEDQICCLGQVKQLRLKVHNTENDAVRWSVEGGEANGTVTETGLYRAPASIATPAAVLVRATSIADPTKSILIPIQIPEVSLTVEADDTNLRPGQTTRLRARIKGCEDTRVTWKLSAEVGYVGPDGVFTAPGLVQGEEVVQVQAVSTADPSKTAVVTLRIRAPG